ncbi:MAG TPA: magnesium transporter [Candidatus Yaniella excrementigallinarum]|nr:magnesium transporter [Candidatus Yaniella excrementigallinarum]
MAYDQLVDIKDLIAEIEDHLTEDNFADVAGRVNTLKPARVIKIFERLGHRRRAIVYRLLDKDLALEVFEGLSPVLQSDLVDALQERDTVDLFANMAPDDRVWLLDELPASVASKLLRGLEPGERDQTAVLLGYPEDSIGRRMSPRFITLRPWHTVAEAMERVHERLEEAETIYYLPVIDTGRRVVGAVSLRQLISGEDSQRVEEFMEHTGTAEVSEDAENVARRTAQRGTFALSVVDHEERLVGIFTLDDAVRILEHEESEDVSRQGGVEPLRRPYLSTPVSRLVRSRITWLLVLAIGATLTVQVLSVFEETLEQVTVLALFVPLLIGTGGNTGNQAATTVTRALALHDIEPRDIFRVLTRELRAGFMLGLLLGGLGFIITALVFEFEVGLVIGLTLLAVCSVAASVGGIMPLIARAINVDPAVFSNPFISTFVDATGLIIYFMIARAILQI